MKTKLLLLFLYIILHTQANDGVYRSTGGQIYPVKETKISIEKEYLSFSIDKGVCEVNIHFEFLNPESEARTLLVGFQAPMSQGDVSDRMKKEERIQNFKIYHNQQIIPYELYLAKDGKSPLFDTNSDHYFMEGEGIFVYLFEIEFKPGINKISHSYQAHAGGSVDNFESYSYVLKTGQLWKGAQIKELEVTFDWGANSQYFIRDVFGNHAKWDIVGIGKMAELKEGDPDFSNKLVRIQNGFLRVALKNFSPTQNIYFGMLNIDKGKSLKNATKSIYFPFLYLKKTNKYAIRLENYSPEERQEIINSIYASYGYSFISKEIRESFEEFYYYIPNPNLKLEDIELSPYQMELIDNIKHWENK